MKIRVMGWLTPEGYDGRVLRGETLTRAVHVDLTLEFVPDDPAPTEPPRGLPAESGDAAVAGRLQVG